MRNCCLAVIAAAGCGFRVDGATPSDAEPGDAAPGEDGAIADAMIDGSPDIDTDGDGIVDATDNCLAIANPDQRNWDQDARGDACDGCPHIASEGGDTDGDDLPDACDPRPSTAGDTRLIWRGFYDTADITGWTPSGGTWSVTGGMLSQTSSQRAVLLSPLMSQRVYVTTGAELAPLPSGGRIGTCSGQLPNNSKYDCCDLLVDGGGTPLVEAATTAAGELRSGWSGSVAAGARVAITQNTVTSSNACSFVQGAITATQSAAKDGSNGHVILWSESTAVKFRYLFVVQIGP